MNGKDNIFDQPMDTPTPFVFDEAVAEVFPDMVKRSVPGYASVIAGTGLITADYIQPGSVCYDLGCSVGASTFSMLQYIKESDFHIIAVDNSSSMISLCQENIKKAGNTDEENQLGGQKRQLGGLILQLGGYLEPTWRPLGGLFKML